VGLPIGPGDYTDTITNPDGTQTLDTYADGLLANQQQLGATGSTVASTNLYYNPLRLLSVASDYTGGTVYQYFQDGAQKSVQLPGHPDPKVVNSLNANTEVPTNVTNANGTQVQQSQNPLGLTSTQSGAEIIASGFDYNADGQLTRLTTYPSGEAGNINDAGAATTTWNYDAASGLLASKFYNDGSSINYQYDSAGRLTSLTAPGLTQTSHYTTGGLQDVVSGYDAQTGLTRSTVNQFDDQGRAAITTSIDNATASTETTAYTPLGDLKSQSFSSAGNSSVNYDYYPAAGYGSSGSPDALQTLTIQMPSQTVQQGYTYDPASKRLQTITVNGVSFTYAYLPNSNQLSSITTGDLTIALNPDTTDPARLGSINVTNADLMLYSANYHYNLLDQIDQANVTQSVVANDGSTSSQTDDYQYAYGTGAGDNTSDAQSLTEVTDNGSVTNSYAYDGVGNFENDSTLGSANPLNQYSNLTYNGRGDVTNDGTYSYTYDANDRMISITPDSLHPGSLQLQYGYDGQGRRLWKDVYWWDSSTNAWNYDYSRHYVSDGSNLVAELDENNNLLQQYTWSANGQLLAITYYPEGNSPTTYLAVIDASGNTAMLVNTADGSVAASYKYDPYGNLLSSSGPAQFVCAILGKGWYYDIEAPTIFHADLRDGKNNIWYERDPAGEIAGGANLNAVVAGDPINLSDTSGLAPVSAQQQGLNALASRYGASWAFRATPTGYIGVQAVSDRQMDFDFRLNQITYFSSDRSWRFEARGDGSLWKIERTAPRWWWRSNEWETTTTQLLPSDAEAQKAQHRAMEDSHNGAFALSDQMAAGNAQNAATLISIRDTILTTMKFGLEAIGAANPLVGGSEILTRTNLEGHPMDGGDYVQAGASLVPGEILLVVGGKLSRVAAGAKARTLLRDALGANPFPVAAQAHHLLPVELFKPLLVKSSQSLELT
jgi:YD repeat-containing protein